MSKSRQQRRKKYRHIQNIISNFEEWSQQQVDIITRQDREIIELRQRLLEQGIDMSRPLLVTNEMIDWAIEQERHYENIARTPLTNCAPILAKWKHKAEIARQVAKKLISADMDTQFAEMIEQ